MKKTLSLIFVAVFLVGLVFPLGSCSGSKETLTVCNWGEYICNEDSEDGKMFDVIKRFEKETGIDVKYVTAESNETLYANMKAGGVNYDVIFPSDYMAQKMLNENMLAKIDFENVPNYENVMDEFKNMYYDPTNEYTVPYFWGTTGIIVNTELCGEVDSWDDMWTEDYPNRVLMFNNPRDAFAVALLKLGYSLNTTDEAQIREAGEELKKMKFNYVMDEFFDLIPSGSAVMAAYYAGDYITVSEDNDKLEFVRPESGVNLFNDVMCIPADAKNKTNAEKFINYMLSAEVGLANTLYVGYSTPNKAVLELLPEDVKNDTVAYPAIDEKWERFEALPNNINDLMRDLWVEIKSSNK